MKFLDEFFNYKIYFYIENISLKREGMEHLQICLGDGLTVGDFKVRPA